VSQVNRATGETMRQQATQEGLVPLKRWLKNALDHVIHVCMNEPGLEFVWVGDDAVDPLEQAQTLQILVGAGIKTREEARADLGLGPTAGAPSDKPQAGLGKFNPHHDERGQFATADGAAATVGSPARKPQPTGVQVDGTNAKPKATQDANQPPTHAPLPPGIQLSAAQMLSCGEAFRACVQRATFAGSPPLNNCFRARDVCLATGLPTIFAPGVIGTN
jgi:hypothetical protein